MAILINFFDNVILQAISEEIVPKMKHSVPPACWQTT